MSVISRSSHLSFRSSAVCALILFFATRAAAADPPAGLAGQIASFTGSKTRVAWVQDMGSGDDEQCESDKLRLMGFDTADGGAERVIVPAISNYYRPLITRAGDRVVYTNWIENRVFVVNWDGSELREIGGDLAEAVWRDPETGVEWVYVRTGLDKKNRRGSGTVVERIQIDHPQVKETVWRNRIHPIEDFQISGDGLRAAAAIPWPDAGVADLSKGTIIHELGNGCWPCMSPDTSYRCWVFDGSHRSLRMYQPGGGKTWNVVINNHPNLSKHEVYHPRWSNHPQFICATGPYVHMKSGGPQVDVYLGKFDAEFRHIEKWEQVTWSDRANFYPDVWIESAARAPVKKIAQAEAGHARAPDTGESKAGDAGRPVFVWESGSKQGQVRDPKTGGFLPAVPEPRGRAFFGRNHELDISDGSFVVKNADGALLENLTRRNELGIETVIIPDLAKQRYPSQIVTFSSTVKSRNFSLTQDGEYLSFRIRTTQTGPNVIKPVLRLCKLQAGKPNHVIVTYRNGRVVCYLNGEKVFDGAGPKGDFSNWSGQHLVFGDEWNQGTAGWDGKLEGVSIYDRAPSLNEAIEHYDRFREKVRDRKPVAQVVVTARLLSATPAPTPESIAPYRRALVVNDYEVQTVISGDLAEKKIQVTHWGVLDSRILPAEWNVGKIYQLKLEKFSDQPQLEGERLVSDSADFGLDLFHAVEAGPVDNRQTSHH